MLFVPSDRNRDLTSSIKCSISCFQDQVGSFKARMELRQTSRVPPSCKRTCMHGKVKCRLEKRGIMQKSKKNAEKIEDEASELNYIMRMLNIILSAT